MQKNIQMLKLLGGEIFSKSILHAQLLHMLGGRHRCKKLGSNAVLMNLALMTRNTASNHCEDKDPQPQTTKKPQPSQQIREGSGGSAEGGHSDRGMSCGCVVPWIAKRTE